MNDIYLMDRSRQRLTLEGVDYAAHDLPRLRAMAEERTDDFLRDLCLFLEDWFSDAPTLQVQTSGSTGTPKQLSVRKEQMMNSARITCEFLRLRPGDTALLCMPLRYIAGKMVVVRALVAGLNLILRTPSGHPLATDDDTPIRFAAMIPLQVDNSLRIPAERERLARIDTLIIGGGSIDADLERELREMPHAIYSTYGMTETLSHIALRRLNGPEASPFYHPFPTVKLSLSLEGTLVIDAPLVCDERLVTNDIAHIQPDGSFRIIGRKDNVINTGGVKVQIEEVEERLRPHLPTPFAITAISDRKFGEAVTLLVAASLSKAEKHLLLSGRNLPQLLEELLPKYQRPKHILYVKAIPQTGSGKTDRAACRTLAKECITKNNTDV